MSSFKYSFYFKLNYVSAFGECLFVVGNIRGLGGWDVSKAFRLDWNEGHYWMGKLVISHNRNVPIEYKYLVCKVEGTRIVKILRWEAGPNRVLDLTKTCNLKCVLDDVWEHRKVVLRIKNEINDSDKFLCIIGDSHELGNMTEPQIMEFVLKKDPQTKMLDRFWEKIFYIHALRSSIRYYYVCYSERDKKYYWERNKERRLDLNFVHVMEQELKLTSGQPSHMSDCIFLKNKLNVFKKIDINFHSNFSFFRVNDNLLYGSFPYNSEEVEYLIRERVNAVLNINNLDRDINFKMINWDVITKYYPDQDLEIIQVHLSDLNLIDLTEKVRLAASILNGLITTNKKVYVQSTLGKYKTMEVVLNYLCIYKKFSLEAALKFIHFKKSFSGKPSKHSSHKKSSHHSSGSKSKKKFLFHQNNFNDSLMIKI